MLKQKVKIEEKKIIECYDIVPGKNFLPSLKDF